MKRKKNTYAKTKMEDKKIFQDMYEQLSGENSEYIKERNELLADVLYTALQIGRKFFSVLVFYIMANIVLLALQLDYAVTCISLWNFFPINTVLLMHILLWYISQCLKSYLEEPLMDRDRNFRDVSGN